MVTDEKTPNVSEGIRRLKSGYGKTEKDFLRYLEHTKGIVFRVQILDTGTMKQTEIEVPYVHRWSEIYRRRVLARFYKLQDWWIKEGRPETTMMTLTTYQGSTRTTKKAKGHWVSREESLRMLQTSWRKLRMMLRNRILRKRFDYVYVMENHKSGYPHMHVAIFERFTKEQKDKVIELWSKRYRTGSKVRGVQFSEEEGFDDRKNTAMDNSPVRSRNDIQWVGFYLIKYLGKTFTDVGEMTNGEIKFHALLWMTGARQWNCSRRLSSVMKLDTEGNDRYRCIKTEIEGPGVQKDVYEMEEEDRKEMILYAVGKLRGDMERYGI